MKATKLCNHLAEFSLQTRFRRSSCTPKLEQKKRQVLAGVMAFTNGRTSLSILCHLVNVVNRLQSRVRLGVCHFLGVLVALHVQAKVTTLEDLIQAKPLLHCHLTALFPSKVRRYSHGDGLAIPTVVNFASLMLALHYQHVLRCQYRGADPDFGELNSSLQVGISIHLLKP
eukprot:6459170-Amphidinium_carterae.1